MIVAVSFSAFVHSTIIGLVFLVVVVVLIVGLVIRVLLDRHVSDVLVEVGVVVIVTVSSMTFVHNSIVVVVFVVVVTVPVTTFVVGLVAVLVLDDFRFVVLLMRSRSVCYGLLKNDVFIQVDGRLMLVMVIFRQLAGGVIFVLENGEHN